MKDMYSRKVAVVTGAGSGIGRALACDLATRGARLAISDVNAATLDETTAMIRAQGGEVHQAVLDVADRPAVAAYAQSVASHYGVVHQLYNNAGIAAGSIGFVDMEVEDFDRVMNINLDGVISGTRAFLPHLIASGAGHLVNISSLNGLMAQPNLTAYCTTKFAVRGFSEALRAEMMRDGHPVEVTVVHPGGIATNIVADRIKELEDLPEDQQAMARKYVQVYRDKLLTMPAETAAKQILDGQANGRRRIVLTSKAKRLDLLIRLMPERYVGMVVDATRKMFDAA